MTAKAAPPTSTPARESLARLDLRWPPALKAQLAALSKQRGVSQSEVTLEAFRQMLERAERPEATLEETLAQIAAAVAPLRALLEGYIRVFLTHLADDPRTWTEARQLAAAEQGAELWEDFQWQVIPDVEGS